jgi:hypothetical protein
LTIVPFGVHKDLEVQIAQIKGILDLNNELRSQIVAGTITPASQVDEQYWRRYDYCAAILRLYASFERFVVDATQKWIDWIVANKFELLAKSTTAVERYRYGTAEILKRSTEPRFSKINVTALVDGLAALQNERAFALSTDALFSTTPNMRFNDVTKVLESVELSQARDWLNGHRPLLEQCDAMQVTSEAFLKELVDRRNESAHGNKLPDDVWAPALIKDAADFVLRFTGAVTELIAARMAESGTSSNSILLATVTELFPRSSACVARVKPVGLWVGMKVLVVSNSRCYFDQVQSIRVGDLPAQAWLPLDEEEVGFGLTKVPPLRANLYSVQGIS